MKKVKGFTLIELLVIVVILAVVGVIIGPGILKVCNQRTVTVTVTDKESHRHGEKKDKYLIYTNDTTYEITDSLLKWRWDSSDLYGKIEVGATYEFKVGGYRIHLLSTYPNIYEAKRVYHTPEKVKGEENGNT